MLSLNRDCFCEFENLVSTIEPALGFDVVFQGKKIVSGFNRADASSFPVCEISWLGFNERSWIYQCI